eukprot:TRINITY_DN5484_c0_g1_i1.p1 TRINITY_DN5484_c0_g1~~TRINITY_DN5484_c0_g1_i1.p1  ORF type:complete len:188 (-),score=18.48 TRINITY_DN5484_c0_g1_i1:311-874(-)
MKGFPVSSEELTADQTSTNWHFAFKELYGKVKSMYNSNSKINRILCPRIFRNDDSASFLLSAGADKVIRYWHLGNLFPPEMAKQSFLIVSPDDREVEYFAEDFKEKVLYENTLTRKSGGLGQSAWQTLNGTAVVKNCMTHSHNFDHTDSILNMELLDLPFATYLVTCGRDNLIKIWAQCLLFLRAKV